MSLHSKAQKLSYKSLFLIIVFLLIPIILLLRINQKATPASAGWWNDGWGYRKAVSITNSVGTTLTDFQVSISIGTSALINSGKMKTDCSDLRVTDVSGKLLPYWFSGCNTDTTQIWPKIPNIPTSGATVYVYYGNPSATSGKSVIGTSNYPGLSCKSILDAGNSTGNSNYWIDPTNGNTSDKFQAYCDMTTDSGGWTRIANIRAEVPLCAYNVALGTNTDIITDTSTTGIMSSTNINGFTRSGTIDGVLVVLSDGNYYRYKSASPSFTWDDVSTRLSLSIQTYTIQGSKNGGVYTSLTNAGCNAPGCLFGGTDATLGGWSTLLGIGGHARGSATQDATCLSGSAAWKGLYSGRVGAIENWGIVGKVYVREIVSNYPNISSGTPATEEFSKAPVAYWSFDEGVGTTTYDSSSNKNNGIFGPGTSAPSWQTEDQCITGKCLRFDGTNDYVNLTRKTLLSGLTFSVWVKTTSTDSTAGYAGNAALNILGDSTENVYLGFGIHGGKVRYNHFVSSWQNVTSSTSVNDGKWHHISVTHNQSSGEVNIYVDGKNDGTGTITYNTTYPAVNRIGSGYNGDYYLGDLDEVKIYPYSRSAAEIKSDYAAGKAHTKSTKGSSANLGTNPKSSEAFSNGLVGYWKMDEGIGTTTLDSSGNNNTATFSSAAWGNGKFGIGASLNGTSNYISVGTSASLGSTNITVATWFKQSGSIPDTYYGCLVSRTDGSGYHDNYNLYIDKNTNILSSRVGFGGTTLKVVTGTTNVFDGAWHHAVTTISYDGTNTIIKLFLDGKFEGQDSQIGTPYTSGLSTNFSLFGAQYFPGLLDEVRIYNRALSPTEVKQLYEYAPGPVAYYNFNEGSGTTAFDTSGNGNNGDWSGTGTHWTAGKYGNAGSFNGTNDWVQIADNNYLEPKSITITSWFKTTSSSEKYIAAKNDDNYYLRISAGKIGFWINTVCTGWLETTNTYNDNNWHHLSVSYSGLSKLIYIDGILSASKNNCEGGDIPTGSSAFQIGTRSSSGTWDWNGSIDEFKIYNYALTQKQIISDMNAGHPNVGSPIASALAHYKFDEGYGTVANNSGNGGATLNGTFGAGNSSPTWSNDGKFGKALSFDGGDNVLLTGSAIDNIGSYGDFSVTTWNNQSSFSGDKTIIAQGQPAYNYGQWWVGTTGTKGLISLYGGASSATYKQVTGTITLSTNTWNQITGIYSRSENLIKLYINGVYDKSTYWDGYIEAVQANKTNLGFNNASDTLLKARYMTGLIDEVKIYNYALTSDEVKLDYNQGKAIVMGSLGGQPAGTGNTAPATAGSQIYCIPGDTSPCSPPVAEWNFEENVGTTAYDTSGNGNHAVFGAGNSAPTWSPGHQNSGSGLKFDGVNDYVSAGNGSNLQVTQLTLETWIKHSSLQAPGVVTWIAKSGGTPTGSQYELRFVPSGAVVFLIGNTATYTFTTGNTVLRADQWNHVVGVVDGSKIRIYVNGVEDATPVNNLVMADNGYPLLIGKRSDGLNFNGSIDNVRIYNYARTPAQIAWDYNRGGPVARWKFDECQGIVAHNSADLAAGGSSLDGTINIGASGAQNIIGTCNLGAGSSSAWGIGATGKINSSLSFDGNDDYVDAGNASSLNPGTSDFSISAWIKPNGSQNYLNSIIDKYSGPGYFISLNGYTPRVFLNDIGGGGYIWQNCGSTSVTNGQWSLLTVVFNRTSNAVCYINGVQTGTVAISTRQQSINTARNLYIGQESVDHGWFNGQIDDVQIFNYALTATQVKTLYSGGAVNFR